MATDAAGNAIEQVVTLGINDLQESGGADTTPPAAPTLTLQDAKIELPRNDRTTVLQSGSMETTFDNAAPSSFEDISIRLAGNGEDSGIYFMGSLLFHWVLGARGGLTVQTIS